MQAANGAASAPPFTGCGSYTLSISGLVDNSDGGRPVATASGGGAICLGGSVELTGSGGTSCVWTPSAGLDNANSCTPVASPTVTTAYSVAVANAGGCVSSPSSPVTVTVNPVPAAPDITAPTTVGAGSPNLTASVPNIMGSTYAWTIGNGTITAGQGTSQITFTAGVAGTLTLGVTETNAAGCVSAPGSATVSVLASGSAMLFYPLIPCRLVDTRNAAGPLGAPSLEPSGSPDRSFAIAGVCGIPSDAQVVSVNVTVTNVQASRDAPSLSRRWIADGGVDDQLPAGHHAREQLADAARARRIRDVQSGALGGVGGALTVFGTLVVVVGFASWLWQKRRGTGGGQGHSGLLWTMLIGALLVTPGVVLPILLTAVDIVLNACITLWNRVSG